ncbi:MAG: lipase [Subtercola sp.]|nr:lipase [Subtercola sp.]
MAGPQWADSAEEVIVDIDIRARLEPEMVATYDAAPPTDVSNIVAAREGSARLAESTKAVPPDPAVKRTDHSIPGRGDAPSVWVREYRAVGHDEPLPALLWMHGGGHIMGHIETDDVVMEHIAKAVGCAVFSVDWRRAPEHPYPAAIEDSHTSVLALYERAAEFRIDPRRIAVGGKSSGAGLAAGVALLLRDRGEFTPRLQLLIYPMLDDRDATVSARSIVDPRLWHRDANNTAWRHYLGEAYGTDAVEAYAAPSRAANLSGLPPTFLIVGELDLFLDEDIEYAQRLLQAGVPTELHVYAGAVHGFETRLPDSPIALQFERDRDEALRRAFSL